MNLNLAMPYTDTCSEPQTPNLAFYSPQSEDMLFTPEHLSTQTPIEIFCQAGIRAVSLAWTLHRNALAKPFRQGVAEALPADRFRTNVWPQDLPPGFYDLRVCLDSGAPASIAPNRRPVSGICTFGWRVSEMAIRDTRPADFMSFWDNAKAAASAIPMDGRIESCIATFGQDAINEYNLTNACLPADYDPDGHTAKEVESYKVSIAGPDGGRVYGWLAKPKGPGPFPAMLILPGGGFAARPRPLEHARHGYLALDIQIHGQDVDLSDYPTIPGHFSDQQYRPVDEYYYYKVHQRVIQAMNYLAFRTDVDAARIAVAGGSQGGRLGLVIAGLDNRVAAVVSAIAHSSNHPHLRWVDGCNGPSKSPVCDGMDLLDAPHLTRLRLRPTSYSM